MTSPDAMHRSGPHPWMRPVTEFVIVFGLCLATLFVVIPAGTAESDNFGLSPRMLPIVAVSFIAAMSVVTLVVGLWRARDRQPETRTGSGGLDGVALLVLATLAGIVMIDRTGLVAGGTVLVLLAALAVGERRPVMLAGMGVGALLILLVVEWSGL